MKEMPRLFLFILVIALFSSCNGEKNQPTIIPSSKPDIYTATNTTHPEILTNPIPSLTPTHKPTITSTQTAKPSRTPIPTSTPFPPYQNKNVIFDYYVIGQLAGYEEFFDPPYGIITRLVLYDDGQMLIAGPGETFNQKVLSSDEIKSFLSRLESLGFYSLESNQKHDPTDKLYDYGNNYQKTYDGLRDCILVNAHKSRTLCIYEPDIQYLIPEMNNILKYIDDYNPAGTTPYIADRIFLSIQEIDEHSPDLPPAVPWSEKFPSLEYDPNRFTSNVSTQVIYIDGTLAEEIYLFFEGSDGLKVVTQNDKDYIIYLRVLLPHEKVINPPQ